LLTAATSCSDSSPTTIVIPEPPPPPQPKLVAYWNTYALDEDYFTWQQFPVDKTGQIYGYIDLKHWDEHYGLEILLMTTDSFAAYKRGGAYFAWHKSVYREGQWYFSFPNVAPGNYVLVVDNTDEGWEETDFDFVNDYAVFDLKAYYLSSY